MITYPLNNILYQAEDAELFHSTRGSGVYAGSDFAYSVTGVDNNITIGEGIGWIKNSKFSGKVIASKAPIVLTLDTADTIYSRIDAVVIQFDANANNTEIIIKKGVASTNPIAPEIIQTETLFELHLYHILRDPNSSAITSSSITDMRLNPQYCGLMADSVTQVDTNAIWAQITELIQNYRNSISEIIEEELQEAKESGEFDGDDYVLTEEDKNDIAGMVNLSDTLTEIQANGTAVDVTNRKANIPAASTSEYGVTKLSSSTSSTSTTLAATPSAVKVAYDLANAAVPKSGGTMTGKLIAQNNTNYTTKQARNIFLIAEGASLPSGANGDICLVYAP